MLLGCLHQMSNHVCLCRVKLATDLRSDKLVAIKILKLSAEHADHYSKEEALHCLNQEVTILHSCKQMRLANVVNIKNASFDGTLVKEYTLLLPTPSSSSRETAGQNIANVVEDVDVNL